MEPGFWLVLAVWIPIVLVWIFGGVFLNRVSGRQRGYGFLFKQTWKTVFAWIIPPWERALKVLIVVALITAGLFMIGTAPRWSVGEVTTGYKYILEEQPCPQTIWDYWTYYNPWTGRSEAGFAPRTVTTWRYNLLEFPMTSTVVSWWLDVGHVLIGLALIIAGFVVAAYSLAKANNQLYGVATPKKRGKRRRK